MITIADLFCGAGGSGLGASVVPDVQVRQLGNAVTPPAAEFLIRAVVDSLGGRPTGSGR